MNASGDAEEGKHMMTYCKCIANIAQGSIIVFLSHFGTFLRPELKFSKHINPLVHIIKAISYSFEQIANALVHSCK